MKFSKCFGTLRLTHHLHRSFIITSAKLQGLFLQSKSTKVYSVFVVAGFWSLKVRSASRSWSLPCVMAPRRHFTHHLKPRGDSSHRGWERVCVWVCVCVILCVCVVAFRCVTQWKVITHTHTHTQTHTPVSLRCVREQWDI